MKKILLFCFSFFTFILYGQRKTIQTLAISNKITVDGNLNEENWATASIASDFYMFEPDNGKPISNDKKTDVKILYDNDAIYIGAVLYDNEPNKILKEITQRDNFGTTDTFGVFINGYNDGQQDFRFFLTAAGTQLDCIATEQNGEDYSWDAVWSSQVKITDFGWIVEMRIPYAALRFSKEKKQTWGLNFVRELKRDRQVYTWTNVDNKVGSVIQQAGTLEGIENIKTPTRLFLLPYSSFYVNAYATQKTKTTLKGGLDIKYGINDAFTLDVILIPDFGQTKYDDQILNLGPFEQQFNENRAFFTEGTDLFSKGNLLYSRRIGGSPSTNPKTDLNEEVQEFPSSVNLINALKVSGRTKKGLGIGILNAITEKTSAIILDTLTHITRRAEVEPLANYNVLVLDQRFNRNSSVSFVNTNVTRNSHFRDANVSALVWDLNTKKNTYNLSGDIKYSYINDVEDKKGFYTSVYLSEISGNYRYSLGGNYVSKDYDINDLGIINETHFHSLYSNASYRILNPTKIFNSFRIGANLYSQFQNTTGKLQGNNIEFELNASTKKNHSIGFGVNAAPLESHDFYEARTDGRYVIYPKSLGAWFYISTNYNNKFAIDINPSYSLLNEKDRETYGFSVGPRYRINDKWSMNYGFNFNRRNNNTGFVDFDNDEIIFARRNVVTYSNSISSKFAVNTKMTFNLTARHYWSYAENNQFLNLQNDGELVPNDGSYTLNKNSNFNSWNLDLSYSWWFAPGSQVSVLYRNNSSHFERELNKDFGKKVTDLLNNDALGHIFSISVKYFIDYNQAKLWL